MRMRFFPLLVFAGGMVAFSQTAPFSMIPRNAQSVLYFPHVVEGGADASNLWQATFTLVNPNAAPANLSMSFYGDDGSPMLLDFGSGPVSSVSAVVPALGTSMFRSQLTNKVQNGTWGWATGQSDIPLFGQLNYRCLQLGKVTAELATAATPGTTQWTSAANANLGIAVANPSPTDMMTYVVDVKDAAGNAVGSHSFQIKPHGHDAFTLYTRFTLPTGFAGSVNITGQTVNPSEFQPAVWTVGWESGSFATLPDGRALSPDDSYARAMRVWGRVMATVHSLGYKVNPKFTIMPGTAPNGIANASGGLDAGGNDQVTMYMSMIEIMGDSDGELAFLMAHQVAHVMQCRSAGCKTAMDTMMGADYEGDADETGMMILTTAGYDSYSAPGAFARLQMGNGQMVMGGMMSGGGIVWEDITSTDPRGFFAARISKMYQVQTRMCGNAQFQTNCQAYKTFMHPNTSGMNMSM
jgi:hypothetical protein